jgi:hypothetical protein
MDFDSSEMKSLILIFGDGLGYDNAQMLIIEYYARRKVNR